MKTYISLVLTGLILSGCCSLTTEQKAKLDNLTPCEKMDGLIAAYDNRFEALKDTKVKTPYLDVWSAKYNVFGNNCQVTSFNNQTVTYRCQENYKDQQQAVAMHQQAVELTRQCLTKNSNWLETQKESETSLRTTFVLDDKSPVISVYTSKTLSKIKTWSTSLEVGKPVATK
ncbi:hypothetical protein [Pseudoalteromonas sp. 2CM36K]|uniref:hypothetical protein n=1 Tax=Pseudoalteromonas sp. 2CM36K TaxID=2929854 RepID=UPI0020BE44BF|nr:hypothetical protein [Pseudoalteromonas sp. 2CM36K]MCK8103893.1 hypothetical protein [Pseudoalteromonas sp. 2CM36K]